MDIKSREIYEAPAAKVILTLKKDLKVVFGRQPVGL